MIDYQKTTVYVTGGAGLVGSHLVDLLVKRGARPIVLDDLSRPGMRNIQGHIHTGNVAYLDTADLRRSVPEIERGAVVFHLAARVTNIQANARDHLGMLQDNLLINANVIEALRRSRPALAVLASTVCVYPHDAPVPTSEEDAWPYRPEPTNEGYGLAKAMLEKQAEYLHRECGVPVVVTRFSNAIGLRDYYDHGSSHVVPALIRRIMDGEEPLRVWGSGNQTRVFVDASDLAQAVVDLADCPAAHDARPVNIGHDREISIRDLAYMVAEACGYPDLQIFFDTAYPDGHARRAVDNRRLQSLIGWVPDTPLETSIAYMVREYKNGGAHV